MSSPTISTFKFLGLTSVGLLTGLSYSLSTLTVPTLLGFSNASSASRAFGSLTARSTTQLSVLAGISSSSFILAYLFSPTNQKHPYLIWTSLLVASSSLTDFALPYLTGKKSSPAVHKVQKSKQKKDKRQMDASYEVVNHESSNSSEGSDHEVEEEVNGEEVRVQMESYMTSQIARTAVAGLAFAMGVVGIWGDGQPAVYEIIF